MINWRQTLCSLIVAMAATVGLHAQQTAAPCIEPLSKPVSHNAALLSRWFELQVATLATRFKWEEDNNGKEAIRQIQYNVLSRARVKIDREGRLSVWGGAGSGVRFNSGWSATGIGTGKLISNLYLKQLYVAAEPTHQVEVQWGGLGFVRGQSTDITSYNLNGYLTGERVILRMNSRLFFDEISMTGGYLGDFFSPGINKRFHRLGQMNYHQFLLAKKLNHRLALSADYTFHEGAETLRQAVKVNLAGFPYLDSLVYENYQRLDVFRAFGYSAQAQKAVTARLRFGGGMADIDKHYGDWNSDRLGKGRRVFVTSSLTLSPEFTLAVLFTRAFSDQSAVLNHTRFEIGLSYDLLKSLKRTGIF